MLSDFLQVCEGCFLTLEDRAHSTKGGSFETLTTIGRVCIFDHTNHVTSYLINQRAGCVELSESKLVVISVVKGVAKIGIKWMNIVETRKVSQHLCQSLRDCLLSKLNFSHTATEKDFCEYTNNLSVSYDKVSLLVNSLERTNSRNFISRVNDGWSFSLCSH